MLIDGLLDGTNNMQAVDETKSRVDFCADIDWNWIANWIQCDYWHFVYSFFNHIIHLKCKAKHIRFQFHYFVEQISISWIRLSMMFTFSNIFHRLVDESHGWLNGKHLNTKLSEQVPLHQFVHAMHSCYRSFKIIENATMAHVNTNIMSSYKVSRL